MSLTSFWCPNYYLQTHFTSCSSIFSVSIVNFEQVKSQLGSRSHRSKKRDIVLLLFVKNVEKRKKRSQRRTQNLRQILNRSFCKNSLLLKVVNNFNKKLHIKIYYGVLKYSLFIVNVIKCYLVAYLCRTPSRRYIYGSFCKALVCNCANDQPYGVSFTDICK